MGRAKDEWIAAQERGWSDPETLVCEACVSEPYLGQLVRLNATEGQCDYCGNAGKGAVVAPASVVIDAVARAIRLYYTDATEAGVPYEGGFLIDPSTTNDVLQSLPLECSDEFFEGVEEALQDAAWVPAANGDWSSSQLSDRMRYSWESLVQLVKHRTRYHFAEQAPEDREQMSAAGLLAEIGHAMQHLQLVRKLPAATPLYRVRIRQPGATWSPTQDSMGAPPNQMAKAGRMNPAGISYFYGALERETAIAEVVSPPPVDVVVAEFMLGHDIEVLDLCTLPDDPSIFDLARQSEYQWLGFLRDFAAAISEPVRKDGNEHVDYVPSQVVSEWFAQVFVLRVKDNEPVRLDGVLYPSAIARGGRNLVLFPAPDTHPRKADTAVFRTHTELALGTWKELAAALGYERRERRGA